MKRCITIEYHDSTYKVLSIKNSTKYLPGDKLSKNQVDSLCNTTSWIVNIVQPKGNSK